MNEDPSFTNRRLKELVEARPFGTATQVFLYEWESSLRVPQKITFPDGTEKTVGYMRDGILTFRDSDETVTYERLLDYPSERKSIVVYRKILDPTITN